ncbi:hypothetical protein N7448_011327 [Penicillium atrosanguineum]|nr:hypothetical protein N7448_011327 [Penicillium atrosanguineum]
MHASAKRLLKGAGGRLIITLRTALEELTDYGVVLCGHSLGGGVAALLATTIVEPNNSLYGTSFVTASYSPSCPLTVDDDTSIKAKPAQSYDLPTGRPIHVYTYGPQAVISPFLRLTSRGLMISVVNGFNIISFLSLGILHDMRIASLFFKFDISGAKPHFRSHLHKRLRQSIIQNGRPMTPSHKRRLWRRRICMGVKDAPYAT